MSFLTDFNGLVRPCFVETGTGQGDTLRTAAANAFEVLHSIECSQGLYLQAVTNFGRDPRVHLWHGESAGILPWILDPTRPTTFWLDAHWSGGEFGEGRPSVECPLLLELEAILAKPWTVPPIILIDDAHALDGSYFQSQGSRDRGFHPEAWPTIEQVRALVPPMFSLRRTETVLRFEVSP